MTGFSTVCGFVFFSACLNVFPMRPVRRRNRLPYFKRAVAFPEKRLSTFFSRWRHRRTLSYMRRIALLALSTSLGLFAGDVNEDLLQASRAGDLAAVKAAVEHGAALEAKTPYGQTPLYLAAMN